MFVQHTNELNTFTLVQKVLPVRLANTKIKLNFVFVIVVDLYAQIEQKKINLFQYAPKSAHKPTVGLRFAF